MLLEMYTAGKKFCYLPFVVSYFGQDGISNQVKYQYRMHTEQVEIASEQMLKSKKEVLIYKERIIDLYVDAELKNQMENGMADSYFAYYLKSCLLHMDRIVCFGCGRIAESLLGTFERAGCQIMYIVDNASQRWGTRWNGYNVYSPERLQEETEIDLLVLNEKYREEILRQLNKMKLPEDINIFDYVTLREHFRNRYKANLIGIGKQRIPAFKQLCESVNVNNQ